MTIKNVVLVGASGLVGSQILDALKASPAHFNITLLTRADSTSPLPSGFPVLKHYYTSPSLIPALSGQDAIICALGATGLLAQILLIDAAVAAGVRRFIPTEYGCDTENPVLAALSPSHVDKRKVYEHLLKAVQANPGFSYTGILGGAFFAWGIQTGFLGYDVKSRTAQIFDGGKISLAYTDIRQNALAVVRALERDVTGYVKISSFSATQLEIVDAFERVSGEKWERKMESTKEAEEVSEQMFRSGDPKKVEEALFFVRPKRWVYGADCKGDWDEADNEKLGLELANLDDMVKIALKI